MAIDLDDPTFCIDHDHTHFDVLAEDLTALFRAALEDGRDADLLADAQATWSHFREEVTRHFWKEERRIFAVLAPMYPDVKEKLEQLTRQHQRMLEEFKELDRLVEGTLEDVAGRKDELQPRWQELVQVLHDHSSAEWELIVELKQRRLIEAAAGDPA